MIDAFRTWLFPALVAIVGTMMWSTLNEIKSDLKTLMSQSAIDKTRIDNLERAVFNNKGTSSTDLPLEQKFPPSPYNIVAIIPPREEIIGLKSKKRQA